MSMFMSMEEFLGICLIILLIRYLPIIIIVYIAKKKNEYIFSGVIALYSLVSNYFFSRVLLSNIFTLFLNFILLYIKALIAFKITRLFKIENKLFFVVAWVIVYVVVKYLIGYVLGYVLTLF